MQRIAEGIYATEQIEMVRHKGFKRKKMVFGMWRRYNAAEVNAATNKILIGVSVVVKGTTLGTQTDVNGT